MKSELKLGVFTVLMSILTFPMWTPLNAQLPPKYATLELFTNTPCPICGSQNPGLFSRLAAYEGEYHLVSFYPGKPYSSCVFYQANISENTARLNFYPMVFGTPTVAINGIQFKSSSGVTNTILDGVTGGESWLKVKVDETFGNTRTAQITLTDHVGGSLETGKLFAVVVERLILYNAPNGETQHHNVFRKFLTDVNGEDVDMSSGMATREYQYTLDAGWQADEVYVIAWLMNPDTKEIYNSGTRFDPSLSGTKDLERLALNVYPNPVSEEVSIVLPNGFSDAVLSVFDASGKVIYDQSTVGNSIVKILTESWPGGSYFAEITTGNKVARGRFQVVR